MTQRRRQPTPSDLLLAALLAWPVQPHSISHLMLRTGLPLGTVLRTLVALESRGWLQAAPHRRYQVAPLGQSLSTSRSSTVEAAGQVFSLAAPAGGAPMERPARLGSVTRSLVELCVAPLPFLIAMRYREELLGALADLPPSERWAQAISAIPLRRHQFDGSQRKCRFGRHVLVLHHDDDGGYLECARCGAFQNTLFHTVS